MLRAKVIAVEGANQRDIGGVVGGKSEASARKLPSRFDTPPVPGTSKNFRCSEKQQKNSYEARAD